MSAVAGIHLGNTNCFVAVSKDGKVETVSNEMGTRMTPTIVAYTGSEKIIGQEAKQFGVRNPRSCITNIKACIGNSFHEDEFNELKKFCSCTVHNKKGEIYHEIKLGEEDKVVVSNTKALSYIFTKLLEIAESFGGDDLEDVVIATPYSFSDQQKMTITEAAESIGFNVLRMISEPAAALLAHNVGQNDTQENYNTLVFRLGGTSSDAALVNVNCGMYNLIGELRKTHFGASSFDDVLVKNFVGEFKKKYKMDITDNRKAMSKLRTACEQCKMGLSRKESSQIAVDSLYEGMDFHGNITRMKFESLSSSLISECMAIVDELLKSNNLQREGIAKIALVGGGTCIPKLISTFKNAFPKAEILDNRSADETMALGAAIQASILQASSKVEHTPKLKCLTKNIGIKVSNSKYEALLAKNTPVPCQQKRSFTIAANQKTIAIPIYEWADGEEATENAKLLAKIVAKDLVVKEEDRKVELITLINKLDNITIILTVDDKKYDVHITNESHHK